MPNQNDPTQNPNPVNPPTDQPTSQTPTSQVPPVIFPESDLPPLSPEFQNLPKNDVPVTPPTDQLVGDGSNAPPPNISSVIPKAKKKFGGGKIIATILGLIILLGGIGAGIILTQQRQLFKQKASETCSNDSDTVLNCRGKEPGYEFCLNGSNMVCIAKSGDLLGCGQDYGGSACDDNPPADTGGGFCGCTPTNCSDTCPNGCANVCGNGCIKYVCPNKDTNSDGECDLRDTGATKQYIAGAGCPGVSCGDECCQIDYTSDGVNSCHPPDCKEINWNCSPTAPPTASPTATPTPTPTLTPTPTPTETPDIPAPACLPVKAYDDSWTALTEAQLSALTVGDHVNFCVNGNATSGTFDKAQFKVNTTLEPEVTEHVRPDSDDFCQAYTISTTDTTVNVKAKIHHSSGVWVGEAI
jgi:hypothetical protein